MTRRDWTWTVFWVLAAGSNPAIASGGTLATATLGAAKDNTLYETAAGDYSNGIGPTLFAGRTGQFENSIRRGLIAFDIAGTIPRGATVNTATLTLHMSRTHSLGNTVSLHRLTSDWGEGSSNAGSGGLGSDGGAGAPAATSDATWLYTFYNTAFWTTPGGDFSATASAAQSVAGVGFYNWSTPQLAADVQEWLDAPATNLGWLLLGNESVGGTAKRFDTRENPTPANRPLLTIGYTSHVAGDADKNGRVDIFDVAVLQTKYGITSGATWADGDFDGNGTVDIFDVAPMQVNYGYGVAASPAPVPEPSTLVLAAAGLAYSAACGYLFRRRR